MKTKNENLYKILRYLGLFLLISITLNSFINYNSAKNALEETVFLAKKTTLINKINFIKNNIMVQELLEEQIGASNLQKINFEDTDIRLIELYETDYFNIDDTCLPVSVQTLLYDLNGELNYHYAIFKKGADNLNTASLNISDVVSNYAKASQILLELPYGNDTEMQLHEVLEILYNIRYDTSSNEENEKN